MIYLVAERDRSRYRIMVSYVLITSEPASCLDVIEDTVHSLQDPEDVVLIHQVADIRHHSITQATLLDAILNTKR